MTKEELEKEAGEWLKDNIRVEIRDGLTFNIVPTPVQIYCAGAEPGEKRIAELEEEVTRLRNENLDIINKYTRFAETDRRTIAELEAQIEKMKCCGNCRCASHSSLDGTFCGRYTQYNKADDKCKYWEIR